ncbi:MAG: response regulator [Deltaproteobacteria bacterium]|nr:response regulator [Deltaproteobacteria bacterium]
MGHILIIEDDPTIRDVVQYALTSAGHAVRTMPDGPSGIASAKADPPALVILDFKMPIMDGGEVLRVLKNFQPDLPVFFFTVLGDFADRSALSEADACFVKSSDLTPLIDAVSRAVAA